MIVALVIFAGVYAVMALGRLPGLRLDRAGAAVIGAALMLALGVLTPREAFRAVDYGTIVLLFGMMLVVASLRLAGFFALAGARVARLARRPLGLLLAILVMAGVLSAFFVNDAVCLAMTPLVLELTLTLGRDPVPYLLALAMGSNAGSVATVTGNPQNILIAGLSGIPYRAFAAALAPIAGISLFVAFWVIAGLHRREFFSSARLRVAADPPAVNRSLLWKSVGISIAVIAAFFAGAPVPVVALLGGAVLLLVGGLKPAAVYAEMDWALLVLFAGLFIVVAGLQKTSAFAHFVSLAAHSPLDHVAVLSAFSAMLSNIVSNVPAVLLFKPFIPHLAHARRAWLALAMSATLAGNLTVLGSVANLIVLEGARDRRRISFWQYTRVGLPVGVVTIVLGALLLR